MAHTQSFDALQPCSMGENAQSHPLAILNKLARIDKHETIHLTKPRSANTRYTFTDRAEKEIHTIVLPIVFHDQAELVIGDVPDSICQPDVYVNIKGTLFVSFKEPGPWGMQPVQRVLLNSLDLVNKSITGLWPFMK